MQGHTLVSVWCRSCCVGDGTERAVDYLTALTSKCDPAFLLSMPPRSGNTFQTSSNTILAILLVSNRRATVNLDGEVIRSIFWRQLGREVDFGVVDARQSSAASRGVEFWSGSAGG